MKIIFVRHGEVDAAGNLTAKGKRQSVEAAKYLLPEYIKHIYSSPKPRAMQTANIIAKKLGVAVTQIDQLKERENYHGILSQKDEELWSENYMTYNYSNPKFKCLKDFLDRANIAFDLIKKEHFDKQENVVIVAHSATLYALGAYMSGVPKNSKVMWMQCSNCAVVKFIFQ